MSATGATGTDAHAIIVGAGPAGSTAAILLARAGWRVALVEKKPFPRRKVCGECLAASNLPLLDALGVGEAFTRLAGAELRRVALMRGTASVLADLPPADGAGPRFGRALGRDALDVLLLAEARRAGAHVMQPCTVREVHGGPGDWHCSLRGAGDPCTLRAPMMIDAHGSWESLPSERAAGTPSHGSGDLLAFKAVFRDVDHAPDTIGVLALDGGYGGIVVADDGRATLAGCVRRDRFDGLRSAFPGTRAGSVFETWLRRECRGVDRALAAATRDGAWLASGPLRPGIRTGTGDGVLRIGNAGAEAHPILGEGMSMALQSAALLCAALLDPRTGIDPRRPPDIACATLALQARHHAAVRREFGPRLRLAAAFAHVAMRPSTSLALTALARATPALLTRGARLGGKTRLAVDPSTLPRPNPGVPA